MRLLWFVLTSTALFVQGYSEPADYKIYAGSTHAHTAFTWSHGEQFLKNGCAGILVYGHNPSSPAGYAWTDGYVKSKNGCYGIYVINSFQYASPSVAVRPDWEKYQGAPSEHFKLAKADGYDFYVTSDHSQEAAFQPPNPDNPDWQAAKHQAAEATDANFVAIAGFEYSENDGPGGTGHINVLNTNGMLNALAPGVDLPFFYKWLEKAQPNGDGPVVGVFNHPTVDQYNNWDYRDPQVSDILTMLEVINSNNKIHYPAFVRALDRGWKVSPVCGNDNHGTAAIARNMSRTFVLAKSKTKAAILDAMKQRRTYASLDKNLQCRYSVNGAVMGSTLQSPKSFDFDISVNDPDTGDPKGVITKIDIVKDGGAVVQTYTPAPDHAVRWRVKVDDSSSKYFFVRIWNAGGGDAPGADRANPVAWLAPVWTGR